jgi:hypothetical protein
MRPCATMRRAGAPGSIIIPARFAVELNKLRHARNRPNQSYIHPRPPSWNPTCVRKYRSDPGGSSRDGDPRGRSRAWPSVMDERPKHGGVAAGGKITRHRPPGTWARQNLAWWSAGEARITHQSQLVALRSPYIVASSFCSTIAGNTAFSRFVVATTLLSRF